MFSHLIDALFSCTHRRYTFPITAKAGQRRSEAASVTGTYVVCLDCGKEFAYDWRQMKVVSASHPSHSVAEPAESYAERAA
jgi:predicted transcriptional regulator